MRMRTLAYYATSLVALAALVLALVALASEPKSSTHVSFAPLSGIYTDARNDVPHYFVSVNVREDRDVQGSMDFEYQDGQTSVVFTFRGVEVPTKSRATSGALTLTTTSTNGSGRAAQSAGSIPATLSVLYGAKSLVFGECTNYLRLAASLAACTFSRSFS